MVKTNPEIIAGEERLDRRAGDESTFKSLQRDVHADELSMGGFLRAQRYWWMRRYALGNRVVSTPWPGASSVVYPLSDMHIGRLKPPLMNLVFGGPRIAQMRPRNRRGYDAKSDCDLVMENLLRGGGPTAIPDLKQQIAYTIDSMCWGGRGIMKVYWDYQSIPRTHVISTRTLAGRLQHLKILPDLDDNERAMLLAGNPMALQTYARAIHIGSMQAAITTLQRMNGPDVLTMLGVQQPVQPLNRAAFDQFAEAIEDEVVRVYELDIEEAEDKLALKDIMKWLRGGMRGEIKVEICDVLRNGPGICNVHPFDFIVPRGTRVNLSGCERITHNLRYTESELANRANDYDLDSKAVEMALNNSHRAMEYSLTEKPPEMERLGASFDISDDGTNGLFSVKETFQREEITPGIWKWTETLWAPGVERALKRKVIDIPPPFVVLPLESNHDGYFDSRGVPEVIRDAEAYGTALLRHMDNNLRITTTPMFKARKTNFIDPEGMQFIPGETVPVTRMDDIEQFPMNSNVFPLERLMSVFLPWPEQLVGTLDIAATQSPKLLEPRTRFEVEQVTRAQQGVLGYRGTLFMFGITVLLQKTWDIFQRYGPPDFWITTTGHEPQKMSIIDIQGSYDVVLEAAVGDMDPNFRYQRALARYQLITDVAGRAQNDPRYAIDPVQAALDVLVWDDPAAIQRLIRTRSPQEQQQMAQQQAADAQRQAVLRDIAQRWAMNAPVGMDEAKMLKQEIMKDAPYKGLQLVVENANAAEAAIQQVASVMAGQGQN